MVIAYVVLAVGYNVAQPPFEPSDERIQFGFVRHLVEARTLPVAEAGIESANHHPPAYFVPAALLAAAWPAPDLADYDGRLNAYARYRHWEPGFDNKNLYLHGPWDAWPWRDTALAVRITRLVSLACGLVVVTLTYQIGRALWTEPVALLAGALVAFTPMFTALSGSLQNDMGAALVGALFLWTGVYYCQTGFTARQSVVWGVIVGLGAITKLTAGFLAPAAVMTILYVAWRQRWPVGRGLQALAILALSASAVAGWWYVRNVLLYGDLTAVNINLETFGGQPTLAAGLASWPTMLPYAWSTFWSRIGMGDLGLPEWLYWALGGVTLAGLGGHWRRAYADGPRLPVMLLILTGLALLMALLVYITLSPTGANGRYTYPALPAYMTSLAAGLMRWVEGGGGRALGSGRSAGGRLPTARQTSAAALLSGLMLAFSAGVLVFYIAPAYGPPPALSALPAEATPLEAQLGLLARLHGYEVETPSPERVLLTLYWEPLSRSAQPYSMYVHLIDAQGVLIAQRDSHPGLGRAATTAWEPGRLFADPVQIILPEGVAAGLVTFKVGLWEPNSGDYAWLLDATGAPIDSGLPFGQLRLPSRP